MAADDRLALVIGWTGIVLFSSLLFLGVGFFKTSLIVFFVLVSCVVGFGRRRLIQASFAISMLAFAVFTGFPHPLEWKNVAKSVWSELQAGYFVMR